MIDKIILIIVTAILALWSPYAMAGETIVSFVEWSTPGPNSQSLVCELSSGPEHLMQGALRCYSNNSKDGKLKKGQKIFEYRDDDRSPISVAPAIGPVSKALITMWESGAYACYIVFGSNQNKIKKLFEHCTKGGIETINDGGNGILFAITDYAPFDPTETTIYHWLDGKLKTVSVPYVQRIEEIKKMQIRHNKSIETDAK